MALTEILQLSRRPARLGNRVLPIRHARETNACVIYGPALSGLFEFERCYIRGAQCRHGSEFFGCAEEWSSGN